MRGTGQPGSSPEELFGPYGAGRAVGPGPLAGPADLALPVPITPVQELVNLAGFLHPAELLDEVDGFLPDELEVQVAGRGGMPASGVAGWS